VDGRLTSKLDADCDVSNNQPTPGKLPINELSGSSRNETRVLNWDSSTWTARWRPDFGGNRPRSSSSTSQTCTPALVMRVCPFARSHASTAICC